MDDEDDMFQFEEENGTIYRDEVKANERTSLGGKFAELLSTSATTTNEKKDKQQLTPEDRFRISVQATSLRMKDEKIYDVSNTDIDNMLEKTTRVVGLKYRNPTAYILGYIATKGGRTLDVANTVYVINKILPQVDSDGGVTAPDVVRYARFWHKYLG